MDLLLFIIGVAAVIALLSNQYAALKKMDKIQSSLNQLNETAEKLLTEENKNKL